MVNFRVTSSLENMDRFLVTPVTARQRSTTSDSSSTPRIASSPLCPLNLALNLEDDDEQDIFDDPLAVQTEVIKLSSQTLLFALSTTNSNDKDCPMQF